jgi:hypothetical protein
LLLSAAIVEELEPVWVCCGWRTPHITKTSPETCRADLDNNLIYIVHLVGYFRSCRGSSS